MTGEIIEVCQDCGKLIEPVEVTGPDGVRYRFTVCLELHLPDTPSWTVPAEDLTRFYPPRGWVPPPISHPRGIIGMTGY